MQDLMQDFAEGLQKEFVQVLQKGLPCCGGPAEGCPCSASLAEGLACVVVLPVQYEKVFNDP